MSKIDTRHLLAAITVADEGGLSRAAVKLNITQSAVSKQILALERFLGHEIFHRVHRNMEATPAGAVFIQHARYALDMQDRAIHLSREAFLETRQVILLGRSPYSDPYYITTLSSIQKTCFPDVRLDIRSNFSPELAKQVLAGVLDLAVLTEGAPDERLSTLELDESPFFALLRIDHPAARKRALTPADLNGAVWARFARHLFPDLYDQFTQDLERGHVQPSAIHHVTTDEEAVQLVYEENAIATLTRHGAWRVLGSGLSIRPFASDAVALRTVLAVKADAAAPLIVRFVKEVGKRLR